MKNKANGNAKLEAEYQSLHSIMQHFSEELTRQLNELLEQKDISLGVPIQSRVKKIDSIVNKIERNSLSINSIKEMEDLIGLRIILLFDRDVATVCHILNSTFRVLKQEDTQQRLQDSQFGYASIHFLIELPAEWLAVPTLAQLASLQAEVQVRTVAQHIWAAASHILQYKQESNVPPPIRRAIYRVSALLETVDLELERVLEQRASYREEIDADSSEVLNVDSLAKLLDENLPAHNKREPEPYSELLGELNHFSVTSGKLREILIKHKKALIKKDAELVNFYKESKLSSERVDRGVWYTHAGLTRVAMRLEYGQAWDKYRTAELRKRLASKRATGKRKPKT
jgi:putative GTP pyrophosphokinase